jgi:hypothetical protein
VTNKHTVAAAVVVMVVISAAVAKPTGQRSADNHARHESRAAVSIATAIAIAAIRHNHRRLRLRIDDLRLRLAINDGLLLVVRLLLLARVAVLCLRLPRLNIARCRIDWGLIRRPMSDEAMTNVAQ